MSDSLDKAIYEIKKQEGPVARAFQEILEDTKRICEPQEQRSETMQTYNLPEAMIKAKENPGTIYETGEDGIAIQFLDSAGCWAKTDYDDHVMLYDHEFRELQPKIQVGDWFQSKNTGVYFKVFGLSAAYEQNYKLQILNGKDDARMKASEINQYSNKITDERALMFLNGGRKPDDWKDGDIATDGVSLYTIGYDWHEDSAREQQFMPVCFAESRVDGGDTP